MTNVGYSGTPLAKKLGIKAGFKIYGFQLPYEYFNWFVSLPDDLQLIPEDALIKTEEEALDWVHLFVKEKSKLEQIFPIVKSKIKKNGSIWVSWPKKTAKVATDLNRDIVREHGLEIGLVDVKVAAVSEVWSGIKFMYRIKDR